MIIKYIAKLRFVKWCRFQYRNIRYYKKLNIHIEYPIEANSFKNIIIEQNVYIGPHAWIAGKGYIEIKSGTIIGPRIKIHTTNHNYEGNMLPYDNVLINKNVVIGRNCWIGSDVIIVPGVTIGEGCIIGTGSVVTKPIPPYSIVGGNPAIILKKRNIETYNKLTNNDQIYLKYKYGYKIFNK